MKVKLTKRLLEDLAAGDGRELWVWDTELPGFGVRVKSSGVKAYVIQYRNLQRQSRKITLGRHGVLTPEEARRMARQTLAAIERGDDPAKEKQDKRDGLTVAELAKRFDEEHVAVRLKPTSQYSYRLHLRCFIVPTIGKLRVVDVTRADIARLHHKLRSTPYQANQCVSIVSKMFNLAELWGLRPDGSNPCRHIKKFPERGRERFLSPAELATLGGVLAEAERDGTEDPYTIAAIRLLIFTGCRRNEILLLRWEYVDFEERCLRLPDSKTGGRVVHLGAPALDVLARIERVSDNPWVICGKHPNKPWNNLRKVWLRIRERAGIEDVRIHDLRHSFASGAVTLGEGLPMIGKLLGHTQIRTTARYAHLAADPVKAAADRVSTSLAAMLNGEASEVLHLRGRVKLLT
jgi:integrase